MTQIAWKSCPSCRDFVAVEEHPEEQDEEMDEESVLYRSPLPCLLLMRAHSAAAKHAAFVRARGRHYSNEAEAMKVRAAHLFQTVLSLTPQ